MNVSFFLESRLSFFSTQHPRSFNCHGNFRPSRHIFASTQMHSRETSDTTAIPKSNIRNPNEPSDWEIIGNRLDAFIEEQEELLK